MVETFCIRLFCLTASAGNSSSEIQNLENETKASKFRCARAYKSARASNFGKCIGDRFQNSVFH